MSKDKSNKNWFARHKVLTVIGVLILIGIIASVSGGSKSGTNGSSNSTAQAAKNKTYRFNDRADKQATDVEVMPNEAATIKGVKMTVTNVKYATSLGEFDNASAGKTYLLADVTVENTSTKTQPYNEADFRVQTAGGQVLDGTIVSSMSSPLNSGDLVAGGKVSGQVVFEVPIETGHQYIIWKPGLDPDRAIVQTK